MTTARLTHPSAETAKVPVGYRADGRPIFPILGAEDDPPPPKADPPKNEPAFPSNTPVEQMTSDQQAAYWKTQSRKHESRAKAFGELTAEQLTELRDKAGRHDALEAELADGTTKAVNEAKKTVQADADAKYQPMLVDTAFRVAIGDRKTAEEVDDFIGDLNLTRFLTDNGTVDTAKVLARVEQFTPAKGGSSQQPRGPLVTPHAPPGGAPVKPGDGARAALAARGIKID